MENLIRLLLLIGQRITFLSEEEREQALDLLRDFATDQGLEDLVPPVKGATNRPPEQTQDEPEVEVDPGVVAEPVPPEEQAPPPTSPEVSAAAGNAFTEPPAGASS